jgi:hypothetical protein
MGNSFLKSTCAGERAPAVSVNFCLFSFALPLSNCCSSVTGNCFLTFAWAWHQMQELSVNLHLFSFSQLLSYIDSAGEQTWKLSINFHKFSFTLLLSCSCSSITGNSFFIVCQGWGANKVYFGLISLIFFYSTTSLQLLISHL